MAVRKPIHWDAMLIICMVFSLIGTVFSILGVVFFINIDAILANPNSRGDVRILPWVFLCTGISFLLIAIVAFLLRRRRDEHVRELVDDGYYVMAEIFAIIPNTAISVNNRHPNNLKCRFYNAFTREEHVFISRNIFADPQHLIGSCVRVYCDPENYSRYYVDVESVLPNV